MKPGDSDWSRVPRRIRAELRRKIFERDGYECQIRGPGCTGTAEQLDHIVPRRVAPERILDETNLRAACGVCNGSHSASASPSREW